MEQFIQAGAQMPSANQSLDASCQKAGVYLAPNPGARRNSKRLSPGDRVAVVAAQSLNSDDYRCDLLSIEFPLYSLSKRAENLEYAFNYRKNRISIAATHAPATIYDKEIMIFCVSQLAKLMNSGEPVSRRIQTSKYLLLRSICRGATGADYRELDAALARLAGTVLTVQTAADSSVVANQKARIGHFSIVSSVTSTLSRDGDYATDCVDIEVCERIVREVEKGRILKIPKAYFRLGGGIERRLYELARKHCGNQKSWRIHLRNMWIKSGSRAELKVFRSAVKAILKKDANVIPGYRMRLTEAGLLVVTPLSEGP